MDNSLKEENKILNRDFGFLSLFKFVLPSILSLVAMAAYQTADGIFIERYVGDLAIGAVNLFYPILSLFVATGIMFGTGGNAIIVRLFGEHRKKEADLAFFRTLTMILVSSVVLTVITLLFREQILPILGATAGNIEYLRTYYTVLCAAGFAIVFQSGAGVLLIGEGKTTTGCIVLLVGGVLNCVLDWLFMSVFGMGIFGAALATAAGYGVTVIFAVYFYFIGKKTLYRFRPCRMDFGQLKLICTNGLSDMISNLSAGVVALFMNLIIGHFLGETGVSALSVVLYFQFIMVAVFMGYTMAVEPLISYNYGAGNKKRLRKINNLSLIWNTVIAVIVTSLMLIFREQIVGFFFEPGTEIYNITLKGLLYAIPAIFFLGMNTYVSGMFTAFSNGLVSAFLSILRTLILLSGFCFLLSWIYGENGLWAAWTVTEIFCFIFSAIFFFAYRNKYSYGKLKDNNRR